MLDAHAISVIITTYNRPDSLRAVLQALNAQTRQGFEVLVADDGSTDETRAMLAAFPARFALHHVWQADAGFRAARSRNLGILKAGSDYIIFLDGDCIPCADFVAHHCRLAETGCFVSGNRILCNPAFTNEILEYQLAVWQWPAWRWLQAYALGRVNRLTPFVRLADGNWRQSASVQHWRGVKTCNLGVWRSALTAINGFDEAYQGWGHEDADLAVRLLQSGQRRKDGRFAVPVLHLWHPATPRAQEQENLRRLVDILDHKRDTVAQRGLDAHC